MKQDGSANEKAALNSLAQCSVKLHLQSWMGSENNDTNSYGYHLSLKSLAWSPVVLHVLYVHRHKLSDLVMMIRTRMYTLFLCVGSTRVGCDIAKLLHGNTQSHLGPWVEKKLKNPTLNPTCFKYLWYIAVFSKMLVAIMWETIKQARFVVAKFSSSSYVL